MVRISSDFLHCFHQDLLHNMRIILCELWHTSRVPRYASLAEINYEPEMKLAVAKGCSQYFICNVEINWHAIISKEWLQYMILSKHDTTPIRMHANVFLHSKTYSRRNTAVRFMIYDLTSNVILPSRKRSTWRKANRNRQERWEFDNKSI